MSAVNLAQDRVEEGQFDSAPNDHPEPPPADPRQGHSFIDDDGLLEWSSEGSIEESDPDEFEQEEDALEAEVFQTLRAEDEDWEITERDFTKQYNRIRQHVAVHTGTAQGVASAIGSKAAVASLPVVNRPRQPKATTTSASQQHQQHAKDKRENQLQALSKYSSRLRNLDLPYDLGVGVNRKGPSATANMKDKSDRATKEQVLDPRTRIILFKMIGRGLLYEVNGCVSTGKEANVYHALTPERRHLALKIYKTSILVFKDRDRYVTGEYRFRRGYSRHNPRKMIRVWAEKEMRNLKRLQIAGINCPEPVEVRENVLVMSFIGDKDGWASPRLKDAHIPETAFPDLYIELMLTTRKMYTECKLVHADLSEYNILYHVYDTASPLPSHEPAPDSSSDLATSTSHGQSIGPPPRGHLCIIDVSQSVEHDHPYAFDFLRADLRNIEDFFSKRGVQTVGVRRSFEFVTRDQLSLDGSKGAEAMLREWMDSPEADGPFSDKKEHEDAVFMGSYIPRTLNEVYDPERDVGVLSRGEGEKLIYKDAIGIIGPSQNRKDEAVAGTKVNMQMGETQRLSVDSPPGREASTIEDTEEEEAEVEEGCGVDSEEEKNEYREKQPRGHRHEDKEAKKERKKAAKEEARDKRKHKIPKAEKKRKIKATARGG